MHLNLFQYKDNPDKFEIGMYIQHPRFGICFTTDERLTRPEAQARIIHLAASFNAEIGDIKVYGKI